MAEIKDPWNLNSLIGQRIEDPLGREEYITVTRAEVDQNRVRGVTKSGKDISIGGEDINVLGNASQNLTQGVVQPKPLSTKVKIQKETLGQTPSVFDPGADLSMPTGEVASVQDVIKEESAVGRKLDASIAGAKFFADILNANSAYNAVAGQAQLNIIQTRNQAADALYRGRQAQTEAQSEGRLAGEKAMLAMAAQGQDVSGSAVQKIQGSYEAIGIFNGMQEEINSVREALGYKLQEVAYDYQIRNAAIERQSAILGSALNFGASSIGAL